MKCYHYYCIQNVLFLILICFKEIFSFESFVNRRLSQVRELISSTTTTTTTTALHYKKSLHRSCSHCTLVRPQQPKKQQWNAYSCWKSRIWFSYEAITTVQLLAKKDNSYSDQSSSKRSGTSELMDCSKEKQITSLQHEKCIIERILRQCNYDQRIIHVSSDHLPILAEVCIQSEYHLAWIVAFVLPKSVNNTDSIKWNRLDPPRFKIELINQINTTTTNNEVIDAGQVTTVWPRTLEDETEWSTNNVQQQIQLQKVEKVQKLPLTIPSPSNTALVVKDIFNEMKKNPAPYLENALDRLYRLYVGRSRSATKSLSKKDIDNLINTEYSKITDEDRNEALKLEIEYCTNVLRKVLKTGTKCSRLIDSTHFHRILYKIPDDVGNQAIKQSNNDYASIQRMKQRAISARILANDAQTGGRYKRWPCIFLSSELIGTDRMSNVVQVKSVAMINGGWTVVDKSVRAGTEARKFTERNIQNLNSDDENKDNDNKQTNKKTTKHLTYSDERIIRRLECLAMGELITSTTTMIEKNSAKIGVNDNSREDAKLELDVRETLLNMNESLSPEGAKKALIRIGRWTETTKGSGKVLVASKLLPWSKDVLEAANWYVDFDTKRQGHYASIIKNENNDRNKIMKLEKRTDLTNLPCISIDTKETKFCDDAIGLRPRAGTGRAVQVDASKWEILIHIVDVSDIYTPDPLLIRDPSDYLSKLRGAAESRGCSRYDLPYGPLHLLPPVALERLAFAQLKMNQPDVPINRCVTLWVYMDERNGKLLDYGVERTLVKTPYKLTYKEASNILGGGSMYDKTSSNRQLQDNEENQVKALLLIINRHIKIWTEKHRIESVIAEARESRLITRENQVKELGLSPNENDRLFQRTDGHKLVDSCLDLYSYAVFSLLQKARAPVPRLPGDGLSRGGRVATAPLRRYIDGILQRQVLAYLCNYGPKMTSQDCKDASKIARDAVQSIRNLQSFRNV